MYYSLEDLNNFDKLDFVMQIEKNLVNKLLFISAIV